MLHRYTKDGLTGIDTLKNRDRALATLLQRVAAEGHLELYLATITKSESGPCDADDTMVDVYELEYSINDWLCLDGSNPGINCRTFTMDELFQVWHLRQNVTAVQSRLWKI